MPRALWNPTASTARLLTNLFQRSDRIEQPDGKQAYPLSWFLTVFLAAVAPVVQRELPLGGVLLVNGRGPSISAKSPMLHEGDGVRLKFLYPGGQVEILDCTWIAIVGLGPNGQEAQSQWVVIDFQGRHIWKPLGYLVQAEVIEENHHPTFRPEETYGKATEDLGYHR